MIDISDIDGRNMEIENLIGKTIKSIDYDISDYPFVLIVFNDGTILNVMENQQAGSISVAINGLKCVGHDDV